ncbi:NYN domain-containing protein [Azoarcus sp. DD4]|uniref:NYN domain-containing protein n=1 Tax=Azoarcus sp. DD4 TaxID=2027405 RepID=UPI0011270B4F|nr:NYN domain-containing protein [Azoarcus sp. DD4]QDF97104.1 NYN domain-containing protein [Azoarcus sp. DD4]
MKSALFVDFDNVYSGLRKLDPKLADQFAQRPQDWLQWLISSLGTPDDAPANAKRRILVRRCYLNPQAYQRFRWSFNLAGFEIIDCPALTSEGKTSTDIHMVLDTIDLLQHEAHYDEFIIFSADADFTPVLRKLRRWDRRTTVLAIGFPSAAYRASADLLIDVDTFVRDALGYRADESSTAAAKTSQEPVASPSRQQALAHAACEVTLRMVADSNEPIPLARIASTILSQVGGIDAESWAGFGSFRKLVESWAPDAVSIDWNGGGAIFDPKRHRPTVAATEAAPTTLGELPDLIKQEVARSPEPVPCARLAQILMARNAGMTADWNGTGSFRRFVESLDLAPLRFDWSGSGGRCYDPSRHGNAAAPAVEPTIRTGPASWGSNEDLLPLATQIHDATGAPLLPPPTYQALFQHIAGDVAASEFELNDTGKRVRDQMRTAGHVISRADVTWILRGLLFRSHVFGRDDDSPENLAKKTANNIRSLCLREQLMLDQAVERAIARWIRNEPYPA